MGVPEFLTSLTHLDGDDQMMRACLTLALTTAPRPCPSSARGGHRSVTNPSMDFLLRGGREGTVSRVSEARHLNEHLGRGARAAAVRRCRTANIPTGRRLVEGAAANRWSRTLGASTDQGCYSRQHRRVLPAASRPRKQRREEAMRLGASTDQRFITISFGIMVLKTITIRQPNSGKI